jgi:hypothetical protein
VRNAAGSDGVSGWLADALRAVSAEIAEATGGPYTPHELERAREWLPSSSTPAG